MYAIQQFKKTLDLFPRYALADLGPSYEQKGMLDKAIDEYLAYEENIGTSAQEIAELRDSYAKEGWQGYWKKRLVLLNQRAKNKPVQAITIARIYKHLGDQDAALAWLQKSYERHEMELIELNFDTSWKDYYSDPRFKDLVRRIGLSQSQ